MKNRRSEERRLTVSVACLMVVGSFAFAHGVQHRVFPGGTGVEATYDDGSPMAFCDVTVVAPGDQGNEHQTGTTDPHGRFAFIPDTNGIWNLSVDDGMGHLVTAEVQIGPNALVGSRPDTRVGRLTGGIVGVSVIFGLFGIYCLCRQNVAQTKRTGGEGESGCTSPKA
ncbi:MAG: hypothetical protein HN341_15975 [Verrucomicrobia bacterium]|jgi:hypothetical protein|nr:hypothetical protein [Verrucomicrobiota bacterium]